MLSALWLSVLVYLILQILVLARAARHSWMIAVTPLLYMLPIIVLTIQAALQQSNMWPILLLLASPVACIHVGLIALSQRGVGTHGANATGH